MLSLTWPRAAVAMRSSAAARRAIASLYRHRRLSKAERIEPIDAD
jgi:hypothetical protein